MKLLRLSPLVLAAALVLLPGCATTSAKPVDSSPPSSGSAETYDNPNYYYLFDDILVPNSMEHSPGDDFSFDTQQFKAGIQVFTGRVVFDDLINFFLNNMAKDGWKKVSAVRSQKSILIFEKNNKAATIELVDGFKAKATIFAIEYKAGAAPVSNARQRQYRPGTAAAKQSPTSAPVDNFTEKDIK